MTTNSKAKEPAKETTPVAPSSDELMKLELESTKSELAELKAQMAEFMALNAPKPEAKVEKKKALDKSKPFATHRQVGGVWYEQDGMKFNAKGDFIGKAK